MAECFSEFFYEPEFGETNSAVRDDLFSLLECLDGATNFPWDEMSTPSIPTKEATLVSQKTSSLQEITSTENDVSETSPKSKRQKQSASNTPTNEEANPQQKGSHITVERNRRKQMNEHLSVLRSLMPCFYVKRGDQASIIGGVVDYINELQQVLQSLEAKKQPKAYSDVLSPRKVSSPRPLPLSPRKPQLSPRLSLSISPRTPQPGSPYRPRLPQQSYVSPTAMASGGTASPSSSSSADTVNELSASSKSAVADVEVKFSGANVLLKTVSSRIPGQTAKIIAAIENLSLKILNVRIDTVEDTILHSFTIKVGIECQLSADELACQIQQTFC